MIAVRPTIQLTLALLTIQAGFISCTSQTSELVQRIVPQEFRENPAVCSQLSSKEIDELLEDGIPEDLDTFRCIEFFSAEALDNVKSFLFYDMEDGSEGRSEDKVEISTPYSDRAVAGKIPIYRIREWYKIKPARLVRAMEFQGTFTGFLTAVPCDEYERLVPAFISSFDDFVKSNELDYRDSDRFGSSVKYASWASLYSRDSTCPPNDAFNELVKEATGLLTPKSPLPLLIFMSQRDSAIAEKLPDGLKKISDVEGLHRTKIMKIMSTMKDGSGNQGSLTTAYCNLVEILSHPTFRFLTLNSAVTIGKEYRRLIKTTIDIKVDTGAKQTSGSRISSTLSMDQIDILVESASNPTAGNLEKVNGMGLIYWPSLLWFRDFDGIIPHLVKRYPQFITRPVTVEVDLTDRIREKLLHYSTYRPSGETITFFPAVSGQKHFKTAKRIAAWSGNDRSTAENMVVIGKARSQVPLAIEDAAENDSGSASLATVYSDLVDEVISKSGSQDPCHLAIFYHHDLKSGKLNRIPNEPSNEYEDGRKLLNRRYVERVGYVKREGAPPMCSIEGVGKAFPTYLDKLEDDSSLSVEEKLAWFYNVAKGFTLTTLYKQEWVADYIAKQLERMPDYNSNDAKSIKSIFSMYRQQVAPNSAELSTLLNGEGSKAHAYLEEFIDNVSFKNWLPTPVCTETDTKKCYVKTVGAFDYSGDQGTVYNEGNVANLKEFLRQITNRMEGGNAFSLTNEQKEETLSALNAFFRGGHGFFVKNKEGNLVPKWTLGKEGGKELGLVIAIALSHGYKLSDDIQSELLNMVTTPRQIDPKSYLEGVFSLYDKWYTEDSEEFNKKIVDGYTSQTQWENVPFPKIASLTDTSFEKLACVLQVVSEAQVAAPPRKMTIKENYLDIVNNHYRFAFVQFLNSFMETLQLNLKVELYRIPSDVLRSLLVAPESARQASLDEKAEI